MIFVSTSALVVAQPSSPAYPRASQDYFLGVPFGTPPLNELRWTSPTPAASWTGVRKAHEFAPDCTSDKSDYVKWSVGVENSCSGFDVSEQLVWLCRVGAWASGWAKACMHMAKQLLLADIAWRQRPLRVLGKLLGLIEDIYVANSCCWAWLIYHRSVANSCCCQEHVRGLPVPQRLSACRLQCPAAAGEGQQLLLHVTAPWPALRIEHQHLLTTPIGCR